MKHKFSGGASGYQARDGPREQMNFRVRRRKQELELMEVCNRPIVQTFFSRNNKNITCLMNFAVRHPTYFDVNLLLISRID